MAMLTLGGDSEGCDVNRSDPGYIARESVSIHNSVCSVSFSQNYHSHQKNNYFSKYNSTASVHLVSKKLLAWVFDSHAPPHY